MTPSALMEKLADGTATPEDRSEFQAYLSSLDDLAYGRALEEYAGILSGYEAAGTSSWEFDSLLREEPEGLQAIAWRIDQRRRDFEASRKRARVIRIGRMAAAASVIFLVVAVGLFLWKKPAPRPFSGQAKDMTADIAPGGNKAVLTLGNGSRIFLDSTETGTVGQIGATRIQNGDGKLAYERGRGGTGDAEGTGGAKNEVQYNILSTPRGGRYKLLLPDGTEVWLNAASSIRYPTAFAGRERSVDITGEAYLEVAADPARPFKVFTTTVSGRDRTEIDVLGTHFDVMAYGEETAWTATLLEGSVKVIRGGGSALLKPGWQAQIGVADGASGRGGTAPEISVLRNADTAMAVAWKNGRFEFDDSGIRTVMSQISRWYGVEVVYEGGVPDKKLTGKISSNVNISSVLNMLEYEGLHLKRDGNKIIVLP